MGTLGMNRTHRAALAVVAAVLAAGGAAWGLTAAEDDDREDAAAVDDTTTTERSTTTERPTTTTSTTAPAATTTIPAPGDVLERSDSGEAIAVAQRRLTELRYDPGPADGTFGPGTTYAVQAFQKVNGMAPDGKVGPAVQMALAAPKTTSSLIPNGGADRVEVDIRTQLLTVYEGGGLKLITHVSTGSGESYCVEGDCGNKAITPVGGFRFEWRYPGWRGSRLGKLYNPVYFTNRGQAVHGSSSVPTYPASHGCVRIPMHIVEYPIYVLDGKKEVGPTAESPSGPPPTSPETTTTPPPEQTTTTTTQPVPEPTTTTTIVPPPPTTIAP